MYPNKSSNQKSASCMTVREEHGDVPSLLAGFIQSGAPPIFTNTHNLHALSSFNGAKTANCKTQ